MTLNVHDNGYAMDLIFFHLHEPKVDTLLVAPLVSVDAGNFAGLIFTCHDINKIYFQYLLFL